MSNYAKLYFQELRHYSTGLVNSFDIILCTVRYGASPANYEMFGFRNLKWNQRATYVTNAVSRKMIHKYNNPKFMNVFEDKVQFAKSFSDYFGRDWISTDNFTFEKFHLYVKKIERGGVRKFICKPRNGSQGQEITVFENWDDEKKVYNDIIKNHANCILENWIEQHPIISKVYPDAVNCLRLITVYKHGKTHVLTGGLTLGVDSKIANGSQKSIICPVNLVTGVLDQPGADPYGGVFECHPSTGEKITGLKLPYWDEVVSMLEDAAGRIPEIAYVGWDIAITPSGPILIEGNTTPGYRYYQLPVHCKDGCGNLKIYKKYL